MTIEQLLGMSADELDAMTKEQREAYFAPFLAITRPDKAPLVNIVQSSAAKQRAKGNTAGMAMAEQFMMKQFGVGLKGL